MPIKPGGQHGHGSVRVRQYISFFILALFLGLFVGAMTAPQKLTGEGALDHLVLSFPQAVNYVPQVDAQKGTLSLTFAGMSVMALQKSLQPFNVRDDGSIKDVRVEADDAQGARLVVTVNNADKKRVRLMRFSAPHQVMINVDDKQALYDKRAVHYTSASLYNA